MTVSVCVRACVLEVIRKMFTVRRFHYSFCALFISQFTL